jgi:hypothetical protein
VTLDLGGGWYAVVNLKSMPGVLIKKRSWRLAMRCPLSTLSLSLSLSLSALLSVFFFLRILLYFFLCKISRLARIKALSVSRLQ